MDPEPSADAWELPFTATEYMGRLRRVRLEMERRGVELLYVTSPPNLNYLLGHEAIWFDARTVTGVAIPLRDERPVFFDSWRHESGWPATVAVPCAPGTPPSTPDGRPADPWRIADGVLTDEGVAFHYPHALEVVTAELRERGLLTGPVALEYWSSAPGGPALAALARRFREAGAEVVNGSWIVDHVRLVKSTQEIAYTRTALGIADRALGRARDALHPGVTEKELAGILYDEVLKAGGDEPGIRMMVHSGPNSNRFHRPASRRAMRKGDLVMIDMSAAFNHYHGNTARAFSLGPNSVWYDALAQVNEALWAVVAAVRPGESTRRLQELTDRAVDDAGLRDRVWWVGGYALGAALPPDWVGHVYLDEREGFEAGYLVPGFVTNWEVLLEDRGAREGAGIIDTLIVSEEAIEAPAGFPRTLTIV